MHAFLRDEIYPLNDCVIISQRDFNSLPQTKKLIANKEILNWHNHCKRKEERCTDNSSQGKSIHISQSWTKSEMDPFPYVKIGLENCFETWNLLTSKETNLESLTDFSRRLSDISAFLVLSMAKMEFSFAFVRCSMSKKIRPQYYRQPTYNHASRPPLFHFLLLSLLLLSSLPLIYLLIYYT